MSDVQNLNPDRVPLTWYEAVAVVQEVADNLLTRRITTVPSVRGLAIDAEGRVRLPSPAPHEHARLNDADAGNELRRLLGDLLKRAPVPAPLQTLLDGRAADGSEVRSLEAFRRALMFFERPGRPRELQALAGRLAEAGEQEQMAAALEELTRRARVDEEWHPRVRLTDPRAFRRRVEQVLIAAGIFLIVLALVGGFVLLPPLPQTLTASSAVDTVTAAGRTVMGELRDRARGLLGSSETRQARPNVRTGQSTAGAPATRTRPKRDGGATGSRASGSAPEPPATRIPRMSDDAPTATTADRAWGTAGARTGRVEALELGWRPLDAADSSAVAAIVGSDVLTEHSPEIYDRRDPEVVPAVLVYPKLPMEAPRGSEKIGVLDVIVSPRGRVEQVRLVATTAERRYRDYMMLSAVKAWIFEPALKDGLPVRYRLEIPLTHFMP